MKVHYRNLIKAHVLAFHMTVKDVLAVRLPPKYNYIEAHLLLVYLIVCTQCWPINWRKIDVWAAEEPEMLSIEM